MAGDVELGYEANPGAVGANLGIVYFRMDGNLCYVGNDGVEHPVVYMTANDVTPALPSISKLGSAGIGFRELFLDYTVTGTVGNVTIDKAAGRVIMANAATTLTCTNARVTANSIVIATAAANDTTGYVKNVVANAGNFVVTCNAPAANMPINFLVIGTD